VVDEGSTAEEESRSQRSCRSPLRPVEALLSMLLSKSHIGKQKRVDHGFRRGSSADSSGNGASTFKMLLWSQVRLALLLGSLSFESSRLKERT